VELRKMPQLRYKVQCRHCACLNPVDASYCQWCKQLLPRRCKSVTSLLPREAAATLKSGLTLPSKIPAKPGGRIAFLKADVEELRGPDGVAAPGRMDASTERILTESPLKAQCSTELLDFSLKIQKQLQEAEALLLACSKSVEAAWALASQRMSDFDSRLSRLDLRLIALSQKDRETGDAASQRDVDVQIAHLEHRFEEFERNAARCGFMTSKACEEDSNLLSLRVTALSESLAAEIRVREEQFKSLATMINKRKYAEDSGLLPPCASVAPAFSLEPFAAYRAPESEASLTWPVHGSRNCLPQMLTRSQDSGHPLSATHQLLSPSFSSTNTCCQSLDPPRSHAPVLQTGQVHQFM